MGADLYLNSILNKARAKHEPELQSLVHKRRALERAGKTEAEKKVMEGRIRELAHHVAAMGSSLSSKPGVRLSTHPAFHHISCTLLP